jgi:hypothetical protein
MDKFSLGGFLAVVDTGGLKNKANTACYYSNDSQHLAFEFTCIKLALKFSIKLAKFFFLIHCEHTKL